MNESKSVISGMMSAESEALIQVKSKLMNIYVEDIEESNNKEFNMNEIDGLALNILNTGLLQPIVAYEFEKGSYRVLAGHRRIKAHELLLEQGHEQFDEIKALVFPLGSLTDNDMEKILLGSNAQREYSTEEKKNILDRAERLYDKLIEEGNKPIGAKHKWIMSITGFGESVARRRSDALKRDSNKSNSDSEEDIELVNLEQYIADVLSTKVKVKKKSISFSYKDEEDRNRILSILGLDD